MNRGNAYAENSWIAMIIKTGDCGGTDTRNTPYAVCQVREQLCDIAISRKCASRLFICHSAKEWQTSKAHRGPLPEVRIVPSASFPSLWPQPERAVQQRSADTAIEDHLPAGGRGLSISLHRARLEDRRRKV